MDPSVRFASEARDLWTVFDPYHAVTYFSPEARGATESIGLRGYWRGYFAARLAPLGPVDAAVATAVLSGFSPDMVARAVPSVWTFAPPADVLRARLSGADGVLQRVLGPNVIASIEMTRAAGLARRAAESGSENGRPLFAANHAMTWPTEPHLVLWHGCTVLREHRGDGHVAALVAAGLDGCEATVSHVADSELSREFVQPTRGWTDEQWDDAAQRLRSRGWLDDSGEITALGHRAREAIEDATDVAAATALQVFTSAELAEFRELMAGFTQRIIEALAVPYPNPMGMPTPRNR